MSTRIALGSHRSSRTWKRSLADDELAVVLDVQHLPGLALHRPRRVGQPRRLDVDRGCELQAEIAPGSPMSGGKSPLKSCIARASGSSVRLTTNWPVRWMLSQVSLRRPSGRLLTENMQSGGSSAKTLKKLKGAALTVPVGPMVVTQAIGRGSTKEIEKLVAVVMVHVGDGVLHRFVPQFAGSTFTPVRSVMSL